MKFGAQLVLPFSTKRQCAIQLTIVANGSAHIPPLLIFRSKGKRIKQEERCKWANRVTIKCQDKAWGHPLITSRRGGGGGTLI